MAEPLSPPAMPYLAELALGGPERFQELEAFLATGNRSSDGSQWRPCDGRTALMLAACASNERAVDLLLPHSKPAQTDYAGNTALGLALAHYGSSTEGIVYLLTEESDASTVLHLLDASVHPKRLVDFLLQRALASPNFDASSIRCLTTAARAIELLRADLMHERQVHRLE
jgi:hypothetical protein